VEQYNKFEDWKTKKKKEIVKTLISQTFSVDLIGISIKISQQFLVEIDKLILYIGM